MQGLSCLHPLDFAPSGGGLLGLSKMVLTALEEDLFSGEVFVFRGRRERR